LAERTVLAAGLALALLLAGCASGPRGGRDGAEASPPSGLERIPSAEPRVEPVRGSGGTSKPYTVLGRSYTPITDDLPLRERGLASWYGRKFHGQSTASGEPYDMYAMTAAHKTMPLPSYARVRNPANGREIIVRVNDRGPFHDGRVIDLSYTAALQLDLLRGVAPVEIERLTNEDIRTGAWRRDGGTMLAAAPVPVPQAMPVAAAPAPQRPPQVVVPSAWAVPVADTSAAPIDPPPPPRGADMVVTELPPLAPAPPPPIAEQPPPSAATAGFWVQLGAFREREGADDLLARAARSAPALAARLRVFSEAGTHRLQAGPFPSREAAGEAVAQVRENLRITPLVVERR